MKKFFKTGITSFVFVVIVIGLDTIFGGNSLASFFERSLVLGFSFALCSMLISLLAPKLERWIGNYFLVYGLLTILFALVLAYTNPWAPFDDKGIPITSFSRLFIGYIIIAICATGFAVLSIKKTLNKVFNFAAYGRRTAQSFASVCRLTRRYVFKWREK